MIVAIEGLIPSEKMNDRRLSSATQPAAPPVKADIYPAEWLREQQHQAAGEDPVATGEAQPAAPQAVAPEPPPPLHSMFEPSRPSVANPFIIPQPLNRVRVWK